MSTATSVSSGPYVGFGLSVDGLWRSTFTAMASPVRVQLGLDTPQPELLHSRVRSLFAEVERQCTRFDPGSDLMQANAAGGDWHTVGRHCFVAVRAAADAHELTDGVFDPRVLRTLAELGYGASRSVRAPGASSRDPLPRARPARDRWRPGLDEDGPAVRIGTEPIDLGGIGKGLALRWAADLLDDAGCTTFLIDAGGDCVARGAGPDGTGWRLGVEDPTGGAQPVAVLEIANDACATSSVRLLSWRLGDSTVHHLIDPRTGRPGDSGLQSVTVVAADPAEAEMWSKVLFLHGDGIGAAAQARGLATLWSRADGSTGMTDAMRRHVCWERT